MKNFFSEFFRRFNKHDLLTLAAALAFYTALSLAPLLLITVSLLGILGGESQVKLISQIQSVIGAQAGETVKVVIEGANERPDLSKIGGIVGLITLIFSASGVFAQLQSSINLVWESSLDAKSGLWLWLRRRFISMGMVFTIGFLSMVSLFITTLLSFVFSQEGTVWNVVNYVASIAIFSTLFAAIYKFLPDKRLHWKNAYAGGFLTAILFTIGKELIGLYLGKSAVASAYGATGSLIIFLIWVYYSSLIVFIGAELTALLTFPKATPQELSQPAKIAV